ncbi:unnamed protein product (macronuclear) [Paramecium tetraurelia]|uniref:Transmembrane protein n=1 Tax=Paramecium tetraurelia TaxID=5888 RepID=A0CX74_PARTE|nr:uncharacterized protein GSPATT00001595001 [Paramecium tetraurelia]CAK75391.1 unnamed protein product [Paramecium tetraurelia]|eukprot:XP_001442788.1 hypothetical protein (macronuclear) [Paramecium tetraurelia strain d4-2]
MNQTNSNNDSSLIQNEDDQNTLLEQNKYESSAFSQIAVEYKYQGPDHPQIAELLELLDEKQRKPLSNQTLESFRQKVIYYEQKFNQNCTFMDNMCQISFYYILTIIVYMSIYFTYLTSVISLKSDDIIVKNSTKLNIVQQLPEFGFMITSFTLAIIIIKNQVILLLLFVFGCIVPAFYLFYVFLDVFNLNNSPINYDMVLLLSVLIISVFNGIVVSVLQQIVETMYNQLAGALFSSGWCLFVIYLLGFLIFSYVIGLEIITAEKVINYIINSLYIPIFVSITFSYVLINARLFDWPAGIIKSALDRIKIKILKQQIEKEQQQSQKLVQISTYMSKFVIYSIGAAYLTMEIIFYILLASELKKTNVNYTAIITLSLELIIIPFYLFLGVFISVSDRKPQYTYLAVPLVIGAPIIFGFLKLGDYLQYEKDITNFTEILYYCPLFVNILWLSLTLMGLDKRRLFINSLGFVCFFIAIPIGVFLPLYNLYQYSSLQVISYIFVVIGMIVLLMVLCYFFYQSLKTIKRAKELADQIVPTFDEFKYYNLTDLAFCINSVCFLISYFIISYFFWYIFDQTNTATVTEGATMFAIMVITPIIFVLINIALGHRSLEITYEFAQDIKELQKLEEQKNRKRIQKRFYQNTAVCCGILVPLTLFIPISLITSNERASIFFEALAIGVPVCFLMYKFLVTIKNHSIAFEDFFQPFVSSLLWCCVIFPFGVIVPTMAVFFNNSDSTFQYFAQGAVGLGLFVCMIGVTGTSLFLSLLLNREEFERKKREILKKVLEMLRENYVLCDISVVGILYMKYLNKLQIIYTKLNAIKNQTQKKKQKQEDLKQLKQSLTENLIQGEPINVIKYDGPELEYDHKLVSRNVYQEYLTLLEQELLDKQKNIIKEQELTGFKKYLMDCLCCRCGLEEMNELENQKNVEIIKLRDLFNLDEDTGQKMNDLIPQFTSVYKIAEETDTLIKKIDYQPEDKQILYKQKYKPVQEIKSEKTDSLSQIQIKKLNDKALGNIKSSDQYFSLQSSDQMIAEFMHEVFMEFANNDQGLEPSICFADLQEFSRMTELHFDLIDYEKYAKTIWVNQTYSLNEVQFAGLIKGMIKGYDGDLFDNLKQLVLDHIYPQLITSMKTLMINFKYSNKKVLQNNKNSDNPFLRQNFTSNAVQTEFTKFDAIKVKQVFQEEVANQSKINQNNAENRAAKLSKKQKEQQYEQGRQEIESAYAQKLPCHKKCCYSCNDWLRVNIIEKYFPNLAAAQPKPKIEKKPMLDHKRQKMPDWKIVAKLTIETLFEATEEYEKNLANQQQKSIEFKPTSSNILALIFKIYDLYSLASVAYNPQVGWFGSTSVSGSDTISGSAFYDSYAFFFYFSLGVSILYGLLGSLSLDAVQKNTFGQDENGNLARFPHIQFILPRVISILSGFFMTVMRTFMDAYICDYSSLPYKFARETSVECLTSEHYIYMGLGLIGVGIYYPLSTYLQPTFQFSDHSLDLKFKSTYIIIYVQAKLLIMGLSSFFNTLDSSFEYQMLFSIGILIFVLGFHIKMEPCFVKWYNIIEQMLILIIIFIYTGAVIIMMTGNNVIGIIFTAVAIAIGFLAIAIYLKRSVIRTGTTQKVSPQDNLSIIEVKPIPEENRLNIYDLIAESQLAQQNQKKPKKKTQDNTDFKEQYPNLDMTVGDPNRSSNLDELVKVKDEINMEPILVNKSNLSKLRL